MEIKIGELFGTFDAFQAIKQYILVLSTIWLMAMKILNYFALKTAHNGERRRKKLNETRKFHIARGRKKGARAEYVGLARICK